jgi:hypothetical protein
MLEQIFSFILWYAVCGAVTMHIGFLILLLWQLRSLLSHCAAFNISAFYSFALDAHIQETVGLNQKSVSWKFYCSSYEWEITVF